jgi:hypothetical protein
MCRSGGTYYSPRCSTDSRSSSKSNRGSQRIHTRNQKRSIRAKRCCRRPSTVSFFLKEDGVCGLFIQLEFFSEFLVIMDETSKMFCVRCRKHCFAPTDITKITNRRNVQMLQAKCSNSREDGTVCGSVVNTFVRKNKKEPSETQPASND